MITRILMIQLRQLGDILLTTPCITAVKTLWPGRCETYFLSHAMGEVILAENPYLDEYFLYHDAMGMAKHLQLIKALRAQQFDVVIDFMNNPRSAMYAWCSGAKRRVAFASARRFLYTEVVPRQAENRYIVDQKFSLLRRVGVKSDDHQMVLPWYEVHTQPLLKFMSHHPALKQSSLRVIMSPTHRRAQRRWPLKSYANLADWLVREHRATITWLWGPGERPVIDELVSLCREKTYVAPACQFREMAALIANHDLFIGNSNGPSHVAVAQNIFSLQLHGPTLASSWSPMNERHFAMQGPFADLNLLTVGSVKTTLTGILDAVKEAASGRAAAQTLRLKWR